MTTGLQQALNDAFQHHNAGRLAEAEAGYMRVLNQNPNHPVALHLMGVAAHQQGQSERAIELIKKALKTDPKYVEAHSNLGLALQALGRHREAANCFRKAISLNARMPEAHSNLGNTLLAQGEPAKAITSYRKALNLNPNFVEAHFNLGNALKDTGKLNEAVSCYRQAIGLNPNLSGTYNNLATVLSDLGKGQEALTCQRRAIALDPTNDHYWKSLLITLEGLSFSTIDEQLETELSHLLGHPAVRPSRMVPLILDALNLDPEFAIQPSAEKLCQTPLFLSLISLTPVTRKEIESTLTRLRASLLEDVSSKGIEEGLLPLLCALALQCFTNEFIFAETDDERLQVEGLLLDIKEALEEKGAPSPSQLALLACYRPLNQFSWAMELDKVDLPAPVQAILKRQVFEPMQEQTLRKEIPALTHIQSGVSEEVREQYEENPYPRWVKTNLPEVGGTVSEVLGSTPLNFDLGKYKSPPSPEILVAGCGTGQHAIGASRRFAMAKVLALDLSLSSLSYAKRKTQELGLDNIEYAQADILELSKLDRRFDVIESGGVLHHLEDPLAGWRNLVDLLRPGGVMMIALYSELAHKDILHGRSVIAEKGYPTTVEGIRQCRQEMLKMAEDGDERIAELCRINDFHSLSECRDLLFHTQEHRFDLLQIKEGLKELKLNFLGFELQDPAALQKFSRENPQKRAFTSLALWHKFEQANPDTFKGMYQFWCQKK